MAATIGGLVEVEAFRDDGTPESVRYRDCDICYETVCEDVHAGRPWRAFYWDIEERLSVCENCVAAYLAQQAGATTGG